MKTLLVSDVKNDWETIRKVLITKYSDLKLMCAVNPEEAMKIVESDGPFGFFILDCESKNYEPDELANSLTDLTGDRPILFIGRSSFITDRIEQATYQANEFNDQITKPLNRDDFLDEFKMKVDLALDWAKKEEFEQALEEIDPDDYIKMKIKSFYLFQTFPYDIHLEITPTQYIKIISANKQYSIRTLSKYAKKNIRYLYIQKDDQIKYLESEATKCLKSMRSIDHKSKDFYLVLLRSITIMHQYILAIGVTPSVLILANALTDVIIEHSEKFKDIGVILENYPIYYEGVASKSLLTSFLSNALAAKMKWESITTRKKLALASLLQDISLPDESMSKISFKTDTRLQTFSNHDIAGYLSHPKSAAEIARQFTTYPDVDFLVENQHELPGRRGFPSRPPNTTLTSLCAVFNICHCLAGELDGEDVNDAQIVKIMKSVSKFFNTGNFKESFKIAKSSLRIKERD